MSDAHSEEGEQVAEWIQDARDWLYDADWSELEAEYPVADPPLEGQVQAFNAAVKRRTLERKNESLEPLQPLDADSAAVIDELRKQVAELKSANEALKRENEKLTTTVDVTSRRLARAPRTSLAVGTWSSTVRLVHTVTAIPPGSNLEDVVVPHRFGGYSVFPHAVAATARRSREYQVEPRRLLTLRFRLLKMDGSPATECDVDPSGVLAFKLTAHYAEDDTLVKIEDFPKLEIDGIVSPLALASTCSAVGGEVNFANFRFAVSSNDTWPRGRQFTLRVSPVDDAHRDNPNLTVYTPPFTVLSKVTASKRPRH